MWCHFFTQLCFGPFPEYFTNTKPIRLGKPDHIDFSFLTVMSWVRSEPKDMRPIDIQDLQAMIDFYTLFVHYLAITTTTKPIGQGFILS